MYCFGALDWMHTADQLPTLSAINLQQIYDADRENVMKQNKGKGG